jgi:selenide, water dikinase
VYVMSDANLSDNPIRLTSLSSCAGCASKLNAETLGKVLAPVSGLFISADFPDLLVGLDRADDAAVWKLDDDRALVVTTDFFTPVVDSPYEYGAIAAANALSDVYAMGGVPFLALNIAALPADLPVEILGAILRGGAEKAREAGVVVAGGHTVKDDEPKYGLVALGFVHPQKMLTKGGARPGDALVLTKPLGFGVTNTAVKQEKASPQDAQEVIGWMSRLNKTAGQLATEFGLRGGTDVTGFSLLGHAWQMASAAGIGFRIHYSQVPFISCARKYAEMGTFPGGSIDNRRYFGSHVHFADEIDEAAQMLLFDAQTSGGLLLAVPQEKLADFQARAKELDQPAWMIGDVVEGNGVEVEGANKVKLQV